MFCILRIWWGWCNHLVWRQNLSQWGYLDCHTATPFPVEPDEFTVMKDQHASYHVLSEAAVLAQSHATSSSNHSLKWTHTVYLCCWLALSVDAEWHFEPVPRWLLVYMHYRTHPKTSAPTPPAPLVQTWSQAITARRTNDDSVDVS